MNFQMNDLFYDVLIVGGGATGLRAAIEAGSHKNIKCAVVSKVHPLRSQTCMAQGGMNASLNNNPGKSDDSIDKHIKDTIVGGSYLSDQNAVELFCESAPECVIELEHLGMIFSRNADGKIAQRPFGGGASPRTCYARDYTGHNLLYTLYSNCLKNNIKFYTECYVSSLIVENNKVQGVVIIDLKTGRIITISAKAIIMATGGATTLYNNNVNSVTTTGDGIALAYKSGATLKDMEFVQFHPTSLANKGILISEAARGEGGHLINNKGERFVDELKSRDVVAQAIQREIDDGRGLNNHVFLDIRHLGEEKIKQKLPQIRKIAMDFSDTDCISALIPVKPAAHYLMGGIDCNEKCETSIKGLFAAGECSCVSVHGANRLGGNSLMETIVFGKIAGSNATNYAINQKNQINPKINKEYEKTITNKISYFKSKKEKELTTYEIRTALYNIMRKSAGIFRSQISLKDGLDQIRLLEDKCNNLYIKNTQNIFNYELVNTFELENMIKLAKCILAGAYARKESRGAHFRTDFPQRNDSSFLKHTIVKYNEKDDPAISYKEVNIKNHYPK